MSDPLNECSELLPEIEPEPKSEPPSILNTTTESNFASETIETVIKESVDLDQPSTSSSSSITQVTTLTQHVTTSVTEDTSCDNLPSDDEEDEFDEFDEFKDKRKRQSLAERLPGNSFYKLAPRVFIFPGAEVYMNDIDDEDDDDSASCADENDTIITSEEVSALRPLVSASPTDPQPQSPGMNSI